MTQNPTFGCGVFLPGEGPGNFPEFTGGGTIDGGNGNNGGDPPDPPTPDVGDPDIITPDTVCACIPETSPFDERIIYRSGGVGVLIAEVTRFYRQNCTEFPNSSEALFAADIARQAILNGQPPPPGGGWALVQPPTLGGGPVGADCKSATGQCGEPCPTVLVDTVWRKEIPIDTDPKPVPPGISGPDETGPCGCVVDYLDPGAPVFLGINAQGCYKYEVRWTYTCKKQLQSDPLVGQNPHLTYSIPPPGGVATGWTVTELARDGTTGTCQSGPGGSCAGSCGYTYVQWKVCPPPPSQAGGISPPPAGPVEPGDVGGGILIDGGGTDPGPGIFGPPIRTPEDDPPGPGVIDVTPIPGGESGPGIAGPPTLIPGDGGPGGNGGGTSLGGDFGTGTIGSLGEGRSAGSISDERSLKQAIANQDINLNDPTVVKEILKLKPDGIQDPTIAFNKNAQSAKLVENDTEFTELFNKKIDSNIHYILKNKNNTNNWDSTKTAGVTPESVLASLKPEIRKILDKIRNYDGTKLNQNQIFSMIGSRILDGSIGEITRFFLQSLADDSQRRVPTTIIRSNIDKVNEVAALILIDKNKIPLDTSKLIGREKQVFKNFKILSSDVDKFLPVTIDGVSRRYYINDDDTFIGRETLSIKDGDYFDVISGGKTTRLFAGSEIDHAFLIPEDTRQRAITLLGGEPGRTLSVSGDKETASGIEYDSSLSSARQPFYVLSAVLSSVQTSPSFGGSFLLKDTTLRYQLMDTSTAAGLDATNEFIKYKANKRIFVLDHEDLIIDYIENTESVNLTQTDIIFNSPKINKTIPLLVRQIPFYIMIYPTNRYEYTIFNDKSRILEIAGDGAVTRQLKCSTLINPEFTQSQTNKFIRYQTDGRDATDVLGRPDTQTRISVINPDDTIFKTGFRKDDKLVSASEYDIDRTKTGFRLLREIINELDTNYELSINGVGKTLTEFDAFSRLNLKQFNILSRLENFSEINRAVSNGLINEVKLIPPIENADNRIVIKKTQLVQRKTTAGVDTFKPIKATGDGVTIISPDEKGEGGFGPAS